MNKVSKVAEGRLELLNLSVSISSAGIADMCSHAWLSFKSQSSDGNIGGAFCSVKIGSICW